MLEKIKVQELKKIKTNGGDVSHLLKKDDQLFAGFGEVYSSAIHNKFVKAWKLHKLMTMNLIVVRGFVKFVFYDEIEQVFRREIIGDDRYSRITVPPGIWFGFQGLSDNESLVINIANIMHSESEVERKAIDQINYDWTRV